ncbi:hypothetical protein HZA73_08005 [candidate division TA06 bacterium]|nr:hypothetical protein [candidate division TA06 bacterium]
MIILSAFASTVVAEDFSKVSIQGAFYPFRASSNVNSYYYQDVSLTPSVEFGVRVKSVKKIGIDFLISAVYSTGCDANANISNYTAYQPAIYAASGKVGLVYDLYSGDRTALGALFYFGGNYKQHLLWNYLDESIFSYTTFAPFCFMGIEPSVEIAKNFVFYTKFGLDIEKRPNSKGFIAVYDPSPYSYSYQYLLVERKDSGVNIALDGFMLGVRYQF